MLEQQAKDSYEFAVILVLLQDRNIHWVYLALKWLILNLVRMTECILADSVDQDETVQYIQFDLECI